MPAWIQNLLREMRRDKDAPFYFHWSFGDENSIGASTDLNFTFTVYADEGESGTPTYRILFSFRKPNGTWVDLGTLTEEELANARELLDGVSELMKVHTKFAKRSWKHKQQERERQLAKELPSWLTGES